MACSSSGESSLGSTPERQTRTMLPHVRKAHHHMEKYGKRYATDRYWSVFFIAIFITWMISCQYVVVIHHGKDYDILADNTTDTKSTSDLIDEKIDYNRVPENSITMGNTSEFVHEEIDNQTNSKNDTDKKMEKWPTTEIILFFLDVCTGNLYRLQERIDKWSIFILGVHIICSICYLTYAVTDFCDNRMLDKHLRVLGATLLFVALIEHLLGAFYAKHFSLLPSHEKLTFWVLPEIILLIVWSSKMYPVSPPKGIFSDRFMGVSIDCDKYVVGVGITVIMSIQLLFMYTTYVLGHVAWGSALFYMIAGGSCYLAFTVYYFGKMTIAYTFHNPVNIYPFAFEDLSRALSTVAGCHFGTVCYQATLIFPRIHATFVMNESSLKTLSTYSLISRFFLTHCKVHTYSTAFTGVIGSNYSDSMRELLRYWSNDIIKDTYFFSCSATLKSTASFLLSTNVLILIYIWSNDLDDRSFSLATCVMYLKMMFMFNLATKLWKVSSDATLFCWVLDYFRSSITEYAGLYEYMFPWCYYHEFYSSSAGDDSDVNF